MPGMRFERYAATAPATMRFLRRAIRTMNRCATARYRSGFLHCRWRGDGLKALVGEVLRVSLYVLQITADLIDFGVLKIEKQLNVSASITHADLFASNHSGQRSQSLLSVQQQSRTTVRTFLLLYGELLKRYRFVCLPKKNRAGRIAAK